MNRKLKRRVVQLGLQHGMPFPHLATFVGSSTPNLRAYCSRLGFPIPPGRKGGPVAYHEGETLLRLKRTGLPLTKLAQALQIPYSTLWHTVQRAEEQEMI
jgi:hypothetical protein